MNVTKYLQETGGEKERDNRIESERVNSLEVVLEQQPLLLSSIIPTHTIIPMHKDYRPFTSVCTMLHLCVLIRQTTPYTSTLFSTTSLFRRMSIVKYVPVLPTPALRAINIKYSIISLQMIRKTYSTFPNFVNSSFLKKTYPHRR